MPKYRIKDLRARFLLGIINLGGYLIWGWSKRGTRSSENLSPNNIFVLQLDEIGDVLLSTPALRQLRRLYPRAKITVAVRRPGYEILSGNPDIDQLLMIDLPRFRTGVAGMKKDGRNIKIAAAPLKARLGTSFDLGIDLRADLRTIYLLKKIGIPHRLSQAIRGGGFWLSHVAPYLGLQHEVERKLSIISFLRPSISLPTDLKLKIWLGSADQQRAEEILKKNGVSFGEKYIVIHPFAGWKPKEWPADRFTQMAQYLAESRRCKVLIIGSSAEKAEAQKIAQATRHPAVINLAGQMDLKATGAVIAGAKLFLGNDSGPLHLACATQTPAIALFGQNTPRRYGPWQNRNITLYHSVECSPCAQTKCQRQPRCLELITTEEVKGAIKKLLKD